MENNSLTPHDNFFKLQLEAKEKAADLIQAALPEPIVSKLNLNSLKLANTSFTDGEVGNFRADVVYECQFGENQSVWITVLLEHKSYVEAFPHLQLMKYMWGVWDREAKKEKFIRPILPILFYHGEKEWTYRSFETYFQGGKVDPVLHPFMPFFDYYFLNLQQLGGEWIEERISILSLRISLRLMQNIRSPRLVEDLEAIFDGIEEMLKTEEGRTNFRNIYVYLFKGSKTPNEKIQEAMDSITFLNTPNPVGSAAWQIEQKATAKVKTEMAIKLLKKGMTLNFVVEVSGLTREEVEVLQQKI